MRTPSLVKPLFLLLPLTLAIGCAAGPEDVTEPDDGADAVPSSGEAAASTDEGDDALADDALADADASEADDPDGEPTGSVALAAKARCGHRIETKCSGGRNPNCWNYVHYRHCGGGTIKVKAVIRFWPDSKCTKVGNNEQLLTIYPALTAQFVRIQRC